MKDSMQVIAKNLKRIRKNEGLTQVELSNVSGISRSYIGDLENARSASMSIQTLQKLSKKLNVTIYDLLVGIE